MINVDAASEKAVMIYSAIESLQKDTKEAWGKLAVPLEQVISANNLTTKGLKERDMMLTHREDIMDGHMSLNRVKIDELQAKVDIVTP
ncbi:MAG TPA: hypothetical protein VHV10_06050 [Ktedonobacteraceae bacterium]|nr:hypothetical protein [Ktedonobacteraceae bacterium]